MTTRKCILVFAFIVTSIFGCSNNEHFNMGEAKIYISHRLHIIASSSLSELDDKPDADRIRVWEFQLQRKKDELSNHGTIVTMAWVDSRPVDQLIASSNPLIVIKWQCGENIVYSSYFFRGQNTTHSNEVPHATLRMSLIEVP